MRLLEFTKLINTGRFLTERDVVNSPTIKQYALQAAQRVTDSAAKAWFQSQLYDYLINKIEDRSVVQQIRQAPVGSPDWLVKKIEIGSPVFQINPDQNIQTQAQTVSDWVNNWMTENPGARINYTWEQAVKASDAWHKELAKGSSHGVELATDPGLIELMVFPNGFRWVMVQSKECLSREGSRMGHCVGGYHPNVTNGTTIILSLRNPKNGPHCTIEVTKPDSDWWNAVIRTAATRAAIAQRQTDHPGQIDLNLQDKTISLPESQQVGVIAQIKGKQNRPPVPAYVPYVRALIEAYPFDISDYGSSDLENIGYYYRDGKLLGLKDVSKLYRKYPNGTAWVTVKQPIRNEWDRDNGGDIKLVDRNWTPIINCNISEREDVSFINSRISVSGDGTAYRDQMLDLVRTWRGGTSNNLASPLHKHFNIYMGNDHIEDRNAAINPVYTGYRFGTPDEVTKAITIPNTNIRIYRMVDFGPSYFSDKLRMFNYIFDGADRLVGQVIPAYTDRGETIDYLSMTADVSVSMPTLLLGISKAIGIPPKNPKLLGLQPDESIKPKDQYGEEILDSQNGDYVFLEDARNKNSVWVFANDHDVPIALITHKDAYPRIDSALYSINNWSDGGLLWYLMLCLEQEGMLGKAIYAYNGHDYGWTTDDTGAWWYVAGATNIRITQTTETADGEKTDPTEITMGDIDENVTSSEFSSISTVYANILEHKMYRYTDESYDENDNETGTEYLFELIPGQDIQYLTFDDYYQPFVKRLQSTGKIH